MSRIPIPTLETMSAEQRRVYDAIVGLRDGHMPAPYRPALHSPELADKWQQLGELLRYRTSLPTRLSELAVLVVARHHDCGYVWTAHEPVALKAGIAAGVAEAIKAGRRPGFQQADEAAVHDYCRELLESKFVGEAVYAAALKHVDVKGIVELTALLGCYVMVAMSLNAHGQSRPLGTEQDSL
ncbi:MAG: carboxymuconolactone decarboxylase family protein [Xanthobacteraceae bacterium]